MKPAIFLDRDGVLTVERGRISLPNETIIYDFAGECIAKLHEKGYFCIVVTNQSGVARGLFSERDLIEFNQKLQSMLELDAIYYCPHHPNGIIPRYRCICMCRKPKTGMIEAACKRFSIDLDKSWVVGDSESDIQLGKQMGIKTCFIYRNNKEMCYSSNMSCRDLFEFVKQV